MHTVNLDLATEEMQQRISGHQVRFETVFQDYFRSLIETFDAPELSRFTPRCLRLVEELSLRGGKRQRVAFLHEAANLAGTRDMDAEDVAALSIELLQTHLLIHDDIIDDAPLRRGGPSTFYEYRADFPEHPQHALGLALLAGDLAAFLAIRVILDSGLAAELVWAMLSAQVTAGIGTFTGQIFDLERDFNGLPSMDLLHSVSDYKAGRSSALAPLQLGLLTAGEDPADHDATLRRYAWAFGVSGQMCDDYLSLFGDGAVTGKPTSADVVDGRFTYAIRKTVVSASNAEKAFLEVVLAKEEASEVDVDTVREIALTNKVDRLLRDEMHRYAEMASTEAATWRGQWNEESVRFFELVPVWGVERAL
ncbi:polyprenyl synthetase family protein [Streptomyces sp. 35G-GA-8]|uniref:polyprenyl synthetase family protein n=1 Tax=Streptomyces sp. 35G-GA-8 TaxID=2939434 RepID=UPI00201F55EC|nr:polyprenyl synthetase family protein [Streptomyces sp. 35G-GA-8]MCL7376991.1 polyprenyl synthetase family protein [Streptomyces sp. 35G-GA-8]